MSDTAKWEHPRDAARDAVVWGLIAGIAKDHKDEARMWLANHLKEESSRGVDAYAGDGTHIGSVTRSAPSTKTDVTDSPAFLAYVIQHRPQMLSVEYRVKDSFLKTLTEVDGIFIDPDGTEVPGVGKRTSSGTVTVTPKPDARDLARRLLERVDMSAIGCGPPELDALPVTRWTEPEVEPEPTNRFDQDRKAAGF